MLQYTQDNIIIKGIKIHYYRTGGKKPPLVLLHGLSDNGLCWTTTAAMLAEDYDVIMVDAQGHGLSGRLDKGFSFQSHAEQVAGLINKLKLNKPIIMGHSMGASTAVNVAIDYPSLPEAIILEDPPWGITGPPERTNMVIELNRLSLDEIVAINREWDPRWPEVERLPWAKAKQQLDPAIFSTTPISLRPYTELVPEIRCPALLIIAENGIVTREIAENAARLWKSRHPFKWVYIRDAGHNIRRDNFPAFRDAVFSFLKDLAA